MDGNISDENEIMEISPNLQFLVECVPIICFNDK